MTASKKPPKPKTCKFCKCKFVPSKPMQAVCGFDCAVDYGVQQKIKKALKEASKQRIEHRQAKEKAKTRGQYLKEAQAIFNQFIRERDKDLPCVSCGRHHQGQYHAGHYRTTKSAPELRFCEKNVFKQCSVCNNYLSGNIREYRISLIKKGIDIDWLDGPHEPKHYSIDDLKQIKAEYKAKLKALLAANPID